MRILFSDEKLFDTDGAYNLQNDRVWASSLSKANARDEIVERKFSQTIIV